MKYKRIFLVVIDSLGVGALNDAHKYGDEGTNTLGHIADSFDNGLNILNLENLGIGNIIDIKGVKKTKPKGYVGKLKEQSIGKDTLTGHFEMMGLYIDKPFLTFDKFPDDLIEEIKKQTNHGVIGNYAASGTEIINVLGKKHIETKDLIIYTSADSVLQIAAHEEVVPLSELYDICEKVRKITMKENWKVARIIARPFIGKDVFTRTSNRHDYAVDPPEKTVLDYLKNNNYDVISIGKIRDIFNGNGITEAYRSTSSIEGMKQTIDFTKKDFTGLCFTNLVDFDSLYGHRRDPIGYGKLLEEFDVLLSDLLKSLNKDDLLILTADHGNDPTHTGTDHTREHVPLIVYNELLKGGILQTGESFADIGATIAENFEIDAPKLGESFLKKIKEWQNGKQLYSRNYRHYY